MDQGVNPDGQRPKLQRRPALESLTLCTLVPNVCGNPQNTSAEQTSRLRTDEIKIKRAKS